MPIVLDYTARIAPAALKAADVYGVCRYLSYSSASWKVIKQAEYDELVRNGIQVFLNWEFDSKDWNTTQGSAHAKEAVKQARALRYPEGSVIIGSADFDMSSSQWSARGQQYSREFASVVQSAGYIPGVYGPWDVLQWTANEGHMKAFWQAGMSKSWSAGRNRNPHPSADIRQMAHKTVGGVDTDWNEIRKIPLWTVHGVQTRGSEMVRLGIKGGDGAVYLTTGNGQKSHIGPALNDALSLGGVPMCWVPDSESLDLVVNVGKVEQSTVDVDKLTSELVDKFWTALRVGIAQEGQQ